MLAQQDRITGDAGINLDIAKKAGIPVNCILDNSDIPLAEQRICQASLIIDAIFGTGLSKPVEGVFARIIEIVNSMEVPVIAVDIPSGISGENGHIMGTAVKAWDTVTFGYPKRGHLLYPGREYAGGHVQKWIAVRQCEAIGVKLFTK